MEQAGLRKAKDLLAYLSNTSTASRCQKIERVADKALAANGRYACVPST